MPRGSEWNHLPIHLLVLILQKLRKTSKSAYSNEKLQLVCKSWRTAFQEHSTQIDDASVRLHGLTDLFHIAKLLPDPVSLNIVGPRNCHEDFYIHPLSAYSRLSGLSLTNISTDKTPRLIDLLLLPAGLRSLALTCFALDGNCFEHIRCVELTSLSFLWQYHPQFDTQDLLKQLPRLEALQIGHMRSSPDSSWAPAGGGNCFGKLKWQTQAIQFWKHCLFTQTVKLDKPGTPRRTINGFELPIEAVNLQKLELNYTTTCTAVLLRLCNLTPSLTYLDLNECKEEDIFVDPDPHPPSTLRLLGFHDMAESFIPLAGHELLSLSCSHPFDRWEEYLPDIPAMSLLTSLTRLELSDYSCTTDFAPLRGLGLRELVLVFSPHIPEAVIVPGALPDLQTLRILEEEVHVDEEAYKYDLQHPQSAGYLEAHHLCRLGAIIFDHPSIRQVSGNCRLFALGMAEGLRGWKKSQNNESPVCRTYWRALFWRSEEPMWTKPLPPSSP